MKERSVDSPYEDKEIRCPKLGGPGHVQLLQNGNGKPSHAARAVSSCWAALF